MCGSIVTLTVDDCWRDHALQFKDLFEENRLKGVFYVISGFVGKEVGGFNFIDWTDLKSMSNSGHEIGSHSFTHRGARLGTLRKGSRFLHQIVNDGIIRSSKRAAYAVKSANEEYNVNHLSQEDEIKLSKAKIEDVLGTTCNSYSYPGGAFTEPIKEIVKSAGYSSARSGLSGFNSKETVDKYSLKVQSWDQTVSLQRANSWVEKALTEHLWLIEVFHAVDLHSYMYSCSRKILEQHLKFIDAHRGELQNFSMSEAL